MREVIKINQDLPTKTVETDDYPMLEAKNPIPHQTKYVGLSNQGKFLPFPKNQQNS